MSEEKKLVPTAEQIQHELENARSIDDFFGKDGVMTRLVGDMLTEMMKAELTGELGYERYEAQGRNSGNSRNGSYTRKVKSSQGEREVEVPRDRKGEYQPKVLEQYQTRTKELEERSIAMYARGMTARDIRDMVGDTYGMTISEQMVSDITNKIIPFVEEWQSRPLEPVYPVIYLDAIHYTLRKDHQVAKRAVYIVLAVNLEGRKEVLGHWVGDGGEGASFWLNVVSDLQNRGVEDVLIACIDGLSGFKDAIQSVFPKVEIQRCIIHQIRNSMKYVSWKDRKAFAADLKQVYQAPTREAAENALLALAETWGDNYAMAVRSWENNWDDLTTMFRFSKDIRRLIYTTNIVEGYNRQLRKVSKNRGVFPSDMAVRKLLWLAHQDIAKKWTMPIPNWVLILNQLAIHFEGCFPL